MFLCCAGLVACRFVNVLEEKTRSKVIYGSLYVWGRDMAFLICFVIFIFLEVFHGL